MNIGIGLKKTAYTPEAYAYEKYLTSKGFKVQLEQEEKLDLNNDINIYIMGFRPYWEKSKGKAFEISKFIYSSFGNYKRFNEKKSLKEEYF